MGWFQTKVQKEVNKDLNGQVEALVKEKRELKEELEELKLKKRLEEQEIAHMVKINEEKLRSDLDREKLRMERDFQKRVNDLEEKTMKEINKSLVEFHGKMEKQFSSELKNMKDLLSTMTKVLPNVNMEITKHIGEPKIIEQKSRR